MEANQRMHARWKNFRAVANAMRGAAEIKRLRQALGEAAGAVLYALPLEEDVAQGARMQEKHPAQHSW